MVCLQESLKNTKNFNIRGYTKYEHQVQTGLVTYVSNTTPHELVECSDQQEPHNLYMLFKINDGDYPFYVCNTYIKPTKLNTDQLPHPHIYGRIIYTGDFNARYAPLEEPAKATTTQSGRKFINFVLNNGIKIHDTPKKTHLGGGRLDYFISHKMDRCVIKAGGEPTLLSDHFAITCQVTTPTLLNLPYRKKKITIPDCLGPHFTHCVLSWFKDYTITNVQSFHDSLVGKIHEYHEEWITKRRNPNRDHSVIKDWTTDEQLTIFKEELDVAILRYKRENTADALSNYLLKLREYRELKSTVRLEHFCQFLQNINSKTETSKVWKEINKLTGKKISAPQTKDKLTLANELLQQYSTTSSFANLPSTIQQALNKNNMHRQTCIDRACSQLSDIDTCEITTVELDRALSQGKSTAPGEDGITYQVIRLLNHNTTNGNPILKLLNHSLVSGILPHQWTKSIIVPIPKPNSNNMRPISLTSCLCKVLERIILNRIKHVIGDKLYSSLYGFMPGKSTRDCFANYMASENHSNITVFIDLQSAFDISNRQVILQHLTTLGIHGKLLTWIRGYLSNRCSSVLYHGCLTDERPFELGTPQGGVLSPFLFNVLMDKLLAPITLTEDDTVICYADDICFRTRTAESMQRILDQFYRRTAVCGFVVSIRKTKTLFTTGQPALPLTLGGVRLDSCEEYRYLGIETPLPKNFIKNLRTKLEKRLRPLRVLAGRNAGVNINICRTFYLTYIRSVVDYHALQLSTLPSCELQILDKIQNKALRIILGCPASTRIVNMLSELNLPTLEDHIHQTVTLYGIKSIQRTDPTHETMFTKQLRDSLSNNDNSDYHKSIRVISTQIRQLNVPVQQLEPDDNTAMPPWKIIQPNIRTPPLPLMREHNETTPQEIRAIVLETIDHELHSFPSPNNTSVIYTDGSLITHTGKAGCSFAAYHHGEIKRTWTSPMPRWTTSTGCELRALLEAVLYAVREHKDVLIITDSKSALQSITSKDPSYRKYSNSIAKNLSTARQFNITVKFLWTPSHIGLLGNDEADRLAKLATTHEPLEQPNLTSNQYKTMLKYQGKEAVKLRSDTQRAASCTVKHYDQFRHIKHKYGMNKMNTGPCDRIAARIRLGYRKIWQLQYEKTGNMHPEHSKCELCSAPGCNTLEHYIDQCPALRHFRPPNLGYIELCMHFCDIETLYPILGLYPSFRM